MALHGIWDEELAYMRSENSYPLNSLQHTQNDFRETQTLKTYENIWHLIRWK